MYLGIDIGSSSSKVAILDEQKRIAAVSVLNLGTGTDAYEEVMKDAMEQAGARKEDIKFVVATGYGRINFKGADKQITEITCHAKGASFLMEDIHTIIDIGGQDAKAIKLGENGQVANFVMNEKCAAGTGRFLEVMARVLGCRIDELSSFAEKSTKEISISSVCTVFAESEVISRLSAGEKVSDVARGAHMAIAKRVMGMAGRVGYEPKVVMTGGVALNQDMVRCMSKEMGCEVAVAPYCQAVGAIGAAVSAYDISHKKEK
ncbi:acyl-CoA dehydratase activase [Anaerovorax odorimutans]|uniref:Acyl-CoA dehydratase activase n=1 Tax=Anaerovorax odorimutans TaxID=109327 RepID=A0ABT1RTZ5_9FIRM|nr:acyl-CoA dehydratase activase [Anaerovorax odorimutans]MCQ4638306.1 acyl-CoA dehydratase activase [Anaerovorax odorimutans]